MGSQPPDTSPAAKLQRQPTEEGEHEECLWHRGCFLKSQQAASLLLWQGGALHEADYRSVV